MNANETKAKHTPGPWKVYTTGKLHWIKSSDGSFLAMCNGYAFLQHPGTDNDANAALIASAPELEAQRDELLAACKALCDRLETMQRAARSCDQHEPARKLGPFHREWLGDGIVSDARAAIMRAEKATP